MTTPWNYDNLAVIPASVPYSSSAGTVGTASALLLAANTKRSVVTVQNTHASQTLYISATDPATVNDLAIVAGASMTMSPAPSNALYALGSGAATSYAILKG